MGRPNWMKYNDLVDELQKQCFEPIIGIEMDNYLSRFRLVTEKKEFLKCVIDQVDVQGGVLVHPDLVEEDSSFLSQFHNPEEIRNLILVSIPLKIEELTVSKDTSERLNYFAFERTEKYKDKKDFCTILYSTFSKFDVIDPEITQPDDFENIFSGKNIYETDSIVKFGLGPTLLSFVYYQIIIKYFKDFHLSKLERSNRFQNYKGKPFKAHDLTKNRSTALSKHNNPKAMALVNDILKELDKKW